MKALPQWFPVVVLGALLAAGAAAWLQFGGGHVAALELAPGSNARNALWAGGAAALATGAGTLPVLLAHNFSQRVYDIFLGLGAGVMLAASAFSLVVPAIGASMAAGAEPMRASLNVGGGILFGMLFMLLLERVCSPDALLEQVTPAAHRMRRAWLFVAAVTLHNFPEGLAIGVAFSGIDPGKAQSLAGAIAIQDFPEGLVVALALCSVGYGRWFSAMLGVASGLIEPVAAFGGVMLIDVAAGLLPYGLALAAGAMLFVIINHVVPEMRENGNGTVASCATVAGFVVMMVLDNAL